MLHTTHQTTTDTETYSSSTAYFNLNSVFSKCLRALCHEYSVKLHLLFQRSKSIADFPSNPLCFCVIFVYNQFVTAAVDTAQRQRPGGRGYLSELPTLVTVQWLRLGSAEEARAADGVVECRGY